MSANHYQKVKSEAILMSEPDLRSSYSITSHLMTFHSCNESLKGCSVRDLDKLMSNHVSRVKRLLSKIITE